VVVAITACVQDAKFLFSDAIVVDACVYSLRAATNRFECTVPVYCFMPEHLHLVIRGASPVADTWAAMTAFKQRSGFWIARHRADFAWQKDFWDHIVRGDEDLYAQIRYIAENPVRRGLVEHWNEYPFTGSLGHDLRRLLQGGEL
jgi:REP-associated tyrosine transposase